LKPKISGITLFQRPLMHQTTPQKNKTAKPKTSTELIKNSESLGGGF
jgi:hypothetical protein